MAEDLDSVVEHVRETIAERAAAWERPRANRVYVGVAREAAPDVGGMLFGELGLRFVTATGSDIGEELEAVYHFAYDAVGLVVNMRVRAPKADPVMQSITPRVPAADWIEREMHDLVGITFEGHPDPRRLILADDWPEGVYPLRREYGDGS